MKKGYEVLAETIAKSIVIDYYHAIQSGDKKAADEAEKAMIYWQKAIPLPIQEIKDLIRSSMYS